MGDISDVESVDNSKSGDSIGSKANKNGGKVKMHRNIPVQYPQLTDSNYDVWSVKMKIIL
jgi:hypothetical protein